MATGDEFNMSGDFRGAVLNIKSTLTNVTQTVQAMPNDNADTKEELKRLIEQLNSLLQTAPAEQADNAEAVALSAKALVDTAAAEKPNKPMLQITGEGLKKAAENLASVMPTVVGIAGQIIAAAFKLVG